MPAALGMQPGYVRDPDGPDLELVLQLAAIRARDAARGSPARAAAEADWRRAYFELLRQGARPHAWPEPAPTH